MADMLEEPLHVPHDDEVREINPEAAAGERREDVHGLFAADAIGGVLDEQE